MKGMASNQNIAWFYQKFKDDLLELSPKFQRKRVWLPIHKDYLLETIFRELPIPEIYYVNKINAETGESIIEIVDGQQRIGSILDFATGQYTIQNPIHGFENIKTFNNLSADQKQKFWQYKLNVRDLEDAKESEIRCIFRRINKYSFPLNAQELRNARFEGQFIQTVEKISENSFWLNSGIFSANDFRRMLDLEYIGILLSTLICGIYNRQDKLDECYVQYEREFEQADEFVEKFKNIIKTIERVLPDIKKTNWCTKSNFFTLFIVIDQLKIDHQNKDALQKLQQGLEEFMSGVEEARLNQDVVIIPFSEYAEAARAGTNDKEIRVRRHKILIDYLKNRLNGSS